MYKHKQWCKAVFFHLSVNTLSSEPLAKAGTAAITAGTFLPIRWLAVLFRKGKSHPTSQSQINFRSSRHLYMVSLFSPIFKFLFFLRGLIGLLVCNALVKTLISLCSSSRNILCTFFLMNRISALTRACQSNRWSYSNFLQSLGLNQTSESW